jgi:hypothetical protein
MYHKLKPGEVYTLKKYGDSNYVKFIVSDAQEDNYGFITKYFIHVLEVKNIVVNTQPAFLMYNSAFLYKDSYALVHHQEDLLPIEKEKAADLINHMLKHEAVKQNNREWFYKLCQNKTLA